MCGKWQVNVGTYIYTFIYAQNGFSIINMSHVIYIYIIFYYMYIMSYHIIYIYIYTIFKSESRHERMKWIKAPWSAQRVKEILLRICSMLHCAMWQETIYMTSEIRQHLFMAVIIFKCLWVNLYRVWVCLRSNPVGTGIKYWQ